MLRHFHINLIEFNFRVEILSIRTSQIEGFTAHKVRPQITNKKLKTQRQLYPCVNWGSINYTDSIDKQLFELIMHD